MVRINFGMYRYCALPMVMWCWMRRGNQPNTDGYYLGASITGSLPVTDNYNESDVDYFQWVIRHDDAITTETALRISFEGDPDAQDWRQLCELPVLCSGLQ